jgi:biotin carboxyl carrier protein
MKQFSEVVTQVSGTLERFVVTDGAEVAPGDVIATVIGDER